MNSSEGTQLRTYHSCQEQQSVYASGSVGDEFVKFASTKMQPSNKRFTEIIYNMTSLGESAGHLRDS